MHKLLLMAAACTGAAQAQLLNKMAQCGPLANSVNKVCGAGNRGSVPTTCKSEACAQVYLPFYRMCGSLLAAIEHDNPNSAQFSALYDDCVVQRGDRSASSGKIVDTGVQSKTLYDFRKNMRPQGWRLTVDGVMGGRSRGTWTPSHDKTCNGMLLKGTIELKHGGFVNVKSPQFSAGTFSGADGIRVCTKATVDYGIKDGAGDLYKVNLNDGTRNTYSADFHTSEAGKKDFDLEDNCDGIISTIPFSQFWPSHWGRVTGKQGSINPDKVNRLGFDVSFVTENGGKNKELNHAACSDHDPSTPCKNINPFGLCVQWVQSYKNADSSPDTPDSGQTKGTEQAVTVYVINKQDQCGESTIPRTWLSPAFRWIPVHAGGSTKVGTCKSAGYTQLLRQPFVVKGTGAPSDPTVTLYGRGATVTVHVINSHGQCGESTIPKSWASAGLKWMSSHGFSAIAGTCKSAGYTQLVRRAFAAKGTGAPSDPMITLYSKPRQSTATVTVHVINDQNQCGESTIPKAWAAVGLKWMAAHDLPAAVGTCSSAGYNKLIREPFEVKGTHAPSDPLVTLYGSGH